MTDYLYFTHISQLDNYIEKISCGPMDAICIGFNITVYNEEDEQIGWIVKIGDEVKNFELGELVVVPKFPFNYSEISLEGSDKDYIGQVSLGWEFEILSNDEIVHCYHINCADANLIHLSKEETNSICLSDVSEFNMVPFKMNRSITQSGLGVFEKVGRLN